MKDLYFSYVKMVRRYRFAMVMGAMLLLTVAAQAQTNTAIPTIGIPTGDMISGLNGWLAVFGPIVIFIGMIPVALALLRYVVNMLRSAFGSAGG